MGTADKPLVETALSIVGDEGLAGVEVGAEAIAGDSIESLQAKTFEQTQGAVDVAVPKSASETPQQLATSQTVSDHVPAEVPTFLAQVIPIQDHVGIREVAERIEKEGANPASAVGNQQQAALGTHCQENHR